MKEQAQEAWDYFSNTGYPSSKDENWRFSNPSPWLLQSLVPLTDKENIKREEFEKYIGCARFITNLDSRFVTYAKYKYKSKAHPLVWEKMGEVGRSKGSNPDEWYATFSPLNIDNLDIENWPISTRDHVLKGGHYVYFQTNSKTSSGSKVTAQHILIFSSIVSNISITLSNSSFCVICYYVISTCHVITVFCYHFKY